VNYPPLPNIPWEETPVGISDVVTRYSAIPIIPRDLISSTNRILTAP
jgi:beta-1,4-mannooligosaccharide/beta-1,4-mannosyl-N-acetylglucosamine phosphorylase